MLTPLQAAGYIAYFRMSTVGIPAHPVRRNDFLALIRSQHTIAQWRAKAVNILNITMAQAMQYGTRETTFAAIEAAYPFQ